MKKFVQLDGNSLLLEDIIPVASGNVKLKLAPAGRKNLKTAHAEVKRLLKSGEVAYGINTGFGALSAVRIPDRKVNELQLNLIRSHACGTGDLLPDRIVKTILLLLANGLSKGHSGCRPVIVETIIEMINKGVVPHVPSQGSLGASGDLIPLAHCALVMIGEGAASYNGKQMSGKAAMKKAAISPVKLEAKEGLNLINGTFVMSAVGGHALLQAERLTKIADICAALTIEITMGTKVACRPEIQETRKHPGHKSTADNILKLVENSEVMESHKDCGKVQDAYSLRCTPQVHGAVKDAMAYARKTLEIEINSASDNPLIIGSEVVSAGNFHGQPLAISLDTLGIAVTDLGNISERRTERLLNPDHSGLPIFLAPDPGLNSGYMMSQYLAAALTLENKGLSFPGSVVSTPVSANKEDFISNGMWSAKKAAVIVENCEKIIAVELMCAAQGKDFLEGMKLGKGTQAAYEAIRSVVPKLGRDRIIQKDLFAVMKIIRDGSFLDAVESAAGKLTV